MALPSNPTHGTIAFVGDNVYQYDSVTNAWLLYRTEREARIEDKFDSDIANFKFSDLADVIVDYVPEDGTILSWDSDLQNWKARQFINWDPLGAIAIKVESFVATEGQTTFTLSKFPLGDVNFYRNGISIPASAVSVAGKVVTYDSDFNESSALDLNDDIQIAYNYGTSVALTANIGELTDVDMTTAPTSGDILSWNGAEFVPSNRLTEVEGDILQAVTDRVYTDNVLSARIDDNDSDIAAQTGNFYVQATPPPGKAHSGWVNTTTMRLNVWDVNEETWIEVSLT